ncbi:unnamed protein product, partial [Laminaria digitata]
MYALRFWHLGVGGSYVWALYELRQHQRTAAVALCGVKACALSILCFCVSLRMGLSFSALCVAHTWYLFNRGCECKRLGASGAMVFVCMEGKWFSTAQVCTKNYIVSEPGSIYHIHR